MRGLTDEVAAEYRRPGSLTEARVAVAVQAALREPLGRVRCLTALIRQERRTRRAVSATLASLRQLERIAP